MTTGNFDLGQGRARAIGCVAVARVCRDGGNGEGDGEEGDGESGGHEEGGSGSNKKTGMASKEGEKLCIVREAGQSLGRLARWEFV